jgi:hypothetical protein
MGANNSICEWSRGVIKYPAVSLTKRNVNFSNDYLDFLSEYEAICEMALAHGSGGIVWGKKPEGQKSHDTVPINISKTVFKTKQLFCVD